MTDVSAKRWALAPTSLAAFIVVTDSQVMTVALAGAMLLAPAARLQASVAAMPSGGKLRAGESAAG